MTTTPGPRTEADKMTAEELEATRCPLCSVRLGHDVRCPRYLGPRKKGPKPRYQGRQP